MANAANKQVHLLEKQDNCPLCETLCDLRGKNIPHKSFANQSANPSAIPYFRVMQWFTPFKIPESQIPISPQSKILSMGSCFAQTIGQKMVDHKFDCLVNPFGTIFNPYSLVKLLETALFQDQFDEAEIVERDGLFFHYASHSDVVADSKDALLQKLLTQRNLVHDYLAEGTHLILTLGTAWVYELVGNGETVANCHKQAGAKFTKRLLALEEMKDKLELLFDNFSRAYPDLKIILTVSPVRHLKDGIPANQLSKSLLRVLCYELEKSRSNILYFPAYEILIDELRDYRFYKTDLIHPSAEAENYIWEKWQTSNFTAETQLKISQIHKINQELAHRPLNPKSEAHRKFLNNLLQKLERLNEEFDFSNEIKEVKSQLDHLIQR